MNTQSHKAVQLYLQPRDIVVPPFVFGKHEVEDAAIKLIEFFVARKNGEWSTFTFKELHDFYVDHRYNPNEMLFGLMGPWYDDGGLGCVREDADLVRHLGHALETTEKFRVRVSSRTYVAQRRGTR